MARMTGEVGSVSEIRESTMEGLYRSRHSRLTHLAFRVLGDRSLAEDAVHQAFLHLWERVLRVGLPRCPDAWLCVAVQTEAREILRARISQDDARSTRRDEPGGSAQQSGDGIFRHEHVEGINVVLGGLPQRQKVVVKLWLEGRSLADSARLLGIAESTARTHWKRALSAARENWTAAAHGSGSLLEESTRSNGVGREGRGGGWVIPKHRVDCIPVGAASA